MGEGRGVKVGAGVGTDEIVLTAVVGTIVAGLEVIVVGSGGWTGVRLGEGVRMAAVVGPDPTGVGVCWSEQAASSARTKSRKQIRRRACLVILLGSQLY